MRLRQGRSAGQLRLLPKASMPAAPLERELVDRIRAGLTKLGLLNWSGRLWIRGGHPPYMPILGSGTPDILFVTRDGRLRGIEAKRTASDDLRATQELWREVAARSGVVVLRTHDCAEALRWALEQ